jgi:hypothetical protein
MVDGTRVPNLAMAIDRVQRDNEFGVTQDCQVRVVGGDDHLTPLFRGLQVTHDGGCDVRRVEVILGLVDDERV